MFIRLKEIGGILLGSIVLTIVCLLFIMVIVLGIALSIIPGLYWLFTGNSTLFWYMLDKATSLIWWPY